MNKKNALLKDAGIIVFLIPSIIYLYVFLYEFGYLLSFDVPPNLIIVDLRVIIETLIKITPRVLIVFLIWNFFTQFIYIDEIDNIIGNRIYDLLSIGFLGVIIAMFSLNRMEILITLAISMTGVVFFFLLFVLIKQRKINGFKNKVINQLEYDNKIDSKTLKKYQITQIGYDNVKKIIYFIALSIAMVMAGSADGATTQNLYYIEDYNNQVAVRVYKDYLISCEIKDKEIIKGNFKIINYSNFESITLTTAKEKIKR